MRHPFRLLLLLVAACGGESLHIDGLYMTTLHEGSFEACTGGTTPEYSKPYFRMEESDGGVSLRYCPNTDPSSCSGGRGVLGDETENGYRTDVYTASGGGMECSLLYEMHAASLVGDELTYRILHHGESGEIDPCTPEEAEARGDQMPCIAYEILVGERVDE